MHVSNAYKTAENAERIYIYIYIYIYTYIYCIISILIPVIMSIMRVLFPSPHISAHIR